MSRDPEMYFCKECVGFIEDDNFREMCAHYCLNSKKCQFFENTICDDLRPLIDWEKMNDLPELS